MRTTESTLDLTLAGTPSVSRLFGIVRAVKVVWRVVLNRRAIGNLGELDDRQLMDIGLRREDVRDALTSSFFEDTSRHLTRTARNRSDAFYRNLRRD